MHFILFHLEDEVRTQTTLSILGAMAQSFKGREMVWEYSKENWDKLHGKYVSSVSLQQPILFF